MIDNMWNSHGDVFVANGDMYLGDRVGSVRSKFVVVVIVVHHDVDIRYVVV